MCACANNLGNGGVGVEREREEREGGRVSIKCGCRERVKRGRKGGRVWV